MPEIMPTRRATTNHLIVSPSKSSSAIKTKTTVREVFKDLPKVCTTAKLATVVNFLPIFFKEFSKKIAIRAIKEFNVRKLFALLEIRHKQRRLLKFEKDAASDPSLYIKEIIEMLNKNVMRGVESSFLKEYTEYYAHTAQDRLDIRLLEPLEMLRDKIRLELGIISSGYKDGIERALKNRGYEFDFIIANDFEESAGKIIKFNLEVFNNKGEILKSVLSDKNIRPGNTVYIGDDWQDEGCFGMVVYPVISFLASEEYKKFFAQKFNAFVPKDKDEFAKYLFSLSN